MAGIEIVHVAVAPVENLNDILVGQVAVVLGKDLYNTRLLLAGKMPKIIAHFNSIQEAESLAGKLKELNLKPMVSGDAKLRNPSISFPACSIKFDPEKVIVYDHNGQSRMLTAENSFLMLRGIVSTSRELETVTFKTKISVPLTVMSGGIPIVRQVKEQQKETTHREEYFLRIYSSDSADQNVEILQNDFDFSFLGNRMVYSSMTNFNLLQSDLRQRFPRIIFDEKLTKFSNPTITSNTLNNIEVNCRLIYNWYKLFAN